MSRKIFLIVVLACVALASGCNALKIRSLKSQIKDLEAQQALSRQRLDGHKQKLSSLQKQSNDVATALRTRNSRVMAYMKEHFIAVSCMAAAGYSLGDDNVFSEDVNNMINAGTFLCIAAAVLSEDFRLEVSNVVAELERASRDVENFKAQIESFKPKIAAASREYTSEKSEFDALSEKIQNLRSELAQLE